MSHFRKHKSIWCVGTALVTLALFVSLSDFSSASSHEKKLGKGRAEIYAEIESTLGLVPTFMKSIPDPALEMEWNLMKQVQMAPGAIPNKYRELIGVAVAAATKCQYCAYFHTEFARLNGATEAEIQDALHYTKSTTGWSTYINGSQADYELFKKEVKAIVKHVQSQSESN